MPRFRSRPYRNGISLCLLFDAELFFVPACSICRHCESIFLAHLLSIEQPWIEALSRREVCFCLVNILSALFLIEAIDSQEDQHGQRPVQVLTLLKEISVLKELDSEYEAGLKTQLEQDAHRLRREKRPHRRSGTG
jgi:hypothetical protein